MNERFIKNLKALRTGKGLKQEDLAVILGLSRSTITKYENDEREPDFNTLQKIADYFGVSTDFLLGRTNQVSETQTKYEVINPFPTNGNPMEDLPEEALKELRHYTEYLYEKWKGWKPGDPPR
jgi:transcriptional regulator with XRE-family HTH domain